ncbi:MAG TPA: TetR family transcriptional regulator, partial [Nocardioidaceae bacterium]|nr:TetR family transcriptional regulator [Nocardioidaceae bacterium]
DLFVDFVVTKQGLATVLQSDDSCFDPLHSYFLERLEPVCAQLLDAAVVSEEIEPGQDPYLLMRGVAGLCASARGNPCDRARLVRLLIAGLRVR